MADVSNNIKVLFGTEDSPRKLAVFQIHSVSTGDTAYLGNHFSKLEKAFAFPQTGTANPAVVPVAGTASITFSAAGLSTDVIVLNAFGGTVW